ncbi:MAG TPA: preprotein translocase subunit SecE [Thermoleophilaceae bacterium]|nr:preprotein translocase subunit SecE [Thermoleophilaceae bacterium]
MARNRQRAKQRQAERRAARRSDGGSRAPGAPDPDAPREDQADGTVSEREEAQADGSRGNIAPPGLEPQAGADLAASAPPEAIGRSDTVVETPPPPLLADPESDPEAAASRGTVGETGEEAQIARDRGKVVAFLIAVWAELQRVQWPNRQQMTTLTGVVLGFVVIAGAYLGLLDAIFSRLVQALL